MRGVLVTGIGAAWLAALVCLPMAAPRAPPELSRSLSRASAAFLLALAGCRFAVATVTDPPLRLTPFYGSKLLGNRRTELFGTMAYRK